MKDIKGFKVDSGVIFIKPRNEARIKITVSEYYDNLYVHIREYQMDGDTGKLFPTPKGISFDPKEVDLIIENLEEVSNILTSLYRRNSGQLSFNFDQLEEV